MGFRRGYKLGFTLFGLGFGLGFGSGLLRKPKPGSMTLVFALVFGGCGEDAVAKAFHFFWSGESMVAGIEGVFYGGGRDARWEE